MAIGTNIRTWFNGTWHEGEVQIITSADHAAWLGSTVFDGARLFEGVTPDLLAHCQRINRSAEALMMTPTLTADQMVEVAHEGLKAYANDTAVYIRPMYWAASGDASAIVPNAESTRFALCLEQIPMAKPEATTRLTTTRFTRPMLESSVCNAKAGCLYPNNARMIAEAASKGYPNALVADALGNVAESATANVFIIKDGEVFTPIANGTFLSGITRARHITNLKADGIKVHESVLSFDDVRDADEVFLSGNMSKVTPVIEFDGTHYQHGPVTRRVRDLYWDWALSA